MLILCIADVERDVGMKNLSRKEALRKGEKMDTVSRQAAIDALCKSECGCNNAECRHRDNTDFCVTCDNVKIIKSLPSAQPEIIHCNSCKYWTQSTGKMKGYGLGRCDFHDADLVTCNGFCYWAERRNDG